MGIPARALFGLFGLVVLVGIAWVFSRDRRAVRWKLVATGVGLQVAFAAVVLEIPAGRVVLEAIASGFILLLGFVHAGSRFVFGKLADEASFGYVFALQALPTIVFFSSLTAVLYHLGLLQRVVRIMAFCITKVLDASGAETTSVCANVFVGQSEAPLAIRPYLEKMTDSELMTVMVGGMAHVAGSVMGAYVGLLAGDNPDDRQFFAKHLLAASVMAAPATFVVAKVLLPEQGEPLTRGTVRLEVEHTHSNLIDAAASGAADGLRLALNVGAMLLAFISLIALLNAPLQSLGRLTWGAHQASIDGMLSSHAGHPVELSLQVVLGFVLAPVAWVIGVPWNDASLVGSLIGEKIVINEFVAYSDLSQHIQELGRHSQVIAAYALCGFANFGSIAIQIAGIGGLAPSRRSDVARFGLHAVLGGSLATLMTATIAGVLSVD